MKLFSEKRTVFRIKFQYSLKKYHLENKFVQGCQFLSYLEDSFPFWGEKVTLKHF